MSKPIQTRIIQIGNSKGVRIPKPVLKQTNLTDEVEIIVEEDRIIIRPFRGVRMGWEEKFKIMAEQGDDHLIDSELIPNQWDEDEWEWQ